MITRPALRYHGGKFRMAPFILPFFPEHQCYVEPFGGAASVLLQKNRSYAEVYNDLDSDIVNFFRVLRDPALSAQLESTCQLTPYAREEFEQAYEPARDPVERARRTVVRAQMGFGSAGASKEATGFRIDTKREYGTAMMDWLRWPQVIQALCQRLQGVLIENRPAIDVMRQHDAPNTLHYVDPPYLHGTRVMRGLRYYRHELSDAEHETLLEVLLALQGYVLVSGYDSELYHDHLKGWRVYRTRSRIAASRGGGVRTEVLWVNPVATDALLYSTLPMEKTA